MSEMLSGLSSEAQNFNWLLNTFAGETAGVINAIAVSSDGLLMASSGRGDGAGSDRLAAIVSGMISLAGGAAANYQLGTLDKVIIDMSEGYLLVIAMNEGCSLGVVASKSASLGGVAFEMGLFANRVGPVLTPRLIHELKNSVLR